MFINYSKKLQTEEVFKIHEISNQCGILFDTARLLYTRKIDTPKKAKQFLNPSKNNFYNPFLLSGMQSAVERIQEAKDYQQSVLIFGDYDADGICATTILYNCLLELGISARYVVPEREDGYGLNLDIIKNLNNQQPIDLVITVDCGISEFENIRFLQENNIDVIVTDHHEIPEQLPNCVLINPKLPNQEYPFDGLCGAGVAFKLGSALIGESAYKYLDYVALATVADSMDLIDENRDMVVEGLKLFSKNKIRPAFSCLIGDNDKKITATSLAYILAPRVNAGGRMQDANTALKLFTSQNIDEIFSLSVKLNTYNIERQAECDRVYSLAKEQINLNELYNNPIIIARGDDWSSGVSGIVASRLVEEYQKPVIVFAKSSSAYKGSCRSLEGINIFELLSASNTYTLGFGGHSQAAGVSVSEQDFDNFVQDVLQNYYIKFSDFKYDARIEAEWNIDSTIDINFAKELEMLEPFGVGNKKPVFTTSVNSVVSKPLRVGSPHYMFKTNCLQMLDFNGEKNINILCLPIEKKIVFDINYSVFKGNESVKGFVKDIVADYSNVDSIYSNLVSAQLQNIINDNCVLTTQAKQIVHIKASEIQIENGYGTLYAICDLNNLSQYENIEKLPKFIYSAPEKNNQNCLVYSLNNLPKGYNSIVYLDNPISVVKTDNTVQISQINGYSFVKKLSLDRSVFAVVFEYLSTLLDKEAFDICSLYNYNHLQMDIEQFLFCTSVFMELGFFAFENGSLKRNFQAKSALTNSIIYSTISNIKETL